MSKFTYILDPGHGGLNSKGEYMTSGKRSPKWADGTIYYEGVGNRSIAKRVAEKLKVLGIKYAYTVTPTDPTDVGLTQRAASANLLHAKTPAVLISIHSNAATPSASGYEVFSSPGQNTSDEYATLWFAEMAKEFPNLKGRKDTSDGDPDKEEKFAILTQTKCPSFLIESMFYTNEVECKMLLDPKVEDRLANVIVRTIQKIEEKIK